MLSLRMTGRPAIQQCRAARPRKCQRIGATSLRLHYLRGAVQTRGWMAGFGHKVISRVSGEMLAQLSGSLQELASKVCPAIVQIEVIGFGPAEEGGVNNQLRSRCEKTGWEKSGSGSECRR
jgi:hypothetical protein